MQTAASTQPRAFLGSSVFNLIDCDPVTLVGEPGRVHMSSFHDDTEPTPKLNELFERVFGSGK